MLSQGFDRRFHSIGYCERDILLELHDLFWFYIVHSVLVSYIIPHLSQKGYTDSSYYLNKSFRIAIYKKLV